MNAGNLVKAAKIKAKRSIWLIFSLVSQVFKQLEKLPKLTEFEKSQLKIYKPSFSKQELNYDKFNFGPLGR